MPQIKVGDVVRVTKIPTGLPDESQKLFELCFGKTFPVEAINNGDVELLVGNVLGVAKHLHSIYLKPDEIELVRNPT